MNLCSHKNLGKKYHSNALFAFAKTGQYTDLKSIFEKYPELKGAENETELNILSIAYFEAKNHRYDIEDDFDILFDRALRLDRKIKSGAAVFQDAVLFNLGLAEYHNRERKERCRKAIKNNSIKKEFNEHQR